MNNARKTTPPLTNSIFLKVSVACSIVSDLSGLLAVGVVLSLSADPPEEVVFFLELARNMFSLTGP